MNLVNKLREGCMQVPKRWSGDIGEFSTVDETKTDELMREAADRIELLANRIRSLEGTLVRIATLAEPDGFETEELNAIRCLAVEATTEQSSVDHLRDVKEPCPFCGSLDLGFQISTEDREGLPCNISCQDCGASGPWTYVKEEELERELPIIPLSLWNKRK